MAYVYVGIGSNVDRYRHITAALDSLSEHFGELAISPVYESLSIGFDGDNFFNLVAGFSCDLSVGKLARQLKAIEFAYGRLANAPKFGARTLDIDILTYDNLVGEIDGVSLPRDEITENAFVLLPLSDVAPEVLHPVVGKQYRALWKAFSHQEQKLWQIDFQWSGN